MLHAPDSVAGVLWPGRELFWEGADVGPFSCAGGGCDAGCCGAEEGEVEGGEEGGGEDYEAVPG